VTTVGLLLPAIALLAHVYVFSEVQPLAASQAAAKYPKNSNVAAMLAFGSRAGLDQTRAVLVAEPAADEVTIEVEFTSLAGSLSFKLVGEPSPDNPRTGRDVPYDVLKAIANRCSPVFLGA
jgi:aspartate dehydrogenase